MRILVCAKQVPEVTDVTVDPETGTLVREGVASILNPFCEYALDLALDLKAVRDDVEIVVVSMGPPQARAVLMRCLEMGADRAILVTDRRFAGADTWATALTIAAIIKKLGGDFDLILVGKHAVDGDTAQTGPEIAECLSIPQITYGVGLDVIDPKKPAKVKAKGKEGAEEKKPKRRIKVRRETELGYETLQMPLPGLVTVSKGAMIRKVCSLQEILDAREKDILVMTADDLDIPTEELGLQGSLTQVVKIFPPSVKSAGTIIDGTADPALAARKVVEVLKQNNFA